MKSKSVLLALGTSLSLGLVNIANADNNNLFQAEKMPTGYSNHDGSLKVAKGKCGAGKCGAGKCGAEEGKSKNGNGKCGASNNKKSDGKCGASNDKKGNGKCGAENKS